MENRYAAQERRNKAVDLIWVHAEPARWEDAVALLREAITLGDVEAYYYLGRCYIWGDAGLGVIHSQKEGIRLYKEGAALHNGSACSNLGRYYAQRCCIYMNIIGIDLGTTNSLASVYQDGKSILITNASGGVLTPSVVAAVENGCILVGEAARQRMITDPELCASSFKRFMGTNKEITLAGQVYHAEELSAFVLRALKRDAEFFLGETVEEAVISVPAYFNDAQRRATKRAGELAVSWHSPFCRKRREYDVFLRHLQNTPQVPLWIWNLPKQKQEPFLSAYFSIMPVESLKRKCYRHKRYFNFDQSPNKL